MQNRYISPQNQNTNKKEIIPEEVRWIMDKIEKLKKEKQYEKYVKQKTPSHNVWLNMLKAFLLCMASFGLLHADSLWSMLLNRYSVLLQDIV